VVRISSSAAAAYAIVGWRKAKIAVCGEIIGIAKQVLAMG
jgi:hypothetical protein